MVAENSSRTGKTAEIPFVSNGVQKNKATISLQIHEEDLVFPPFPSAVLTF